MSEASTHLASVVSDVLIHPTSWKEDRGKLAVALAAYEEYHGIVGVEIEDQKRLRHDLEVLIRDACNIIDGLCRDADKTYDWIYTTFVPALRERVNYPRQQDRVSDAHACRARPDHEAFYCTLAPGHPGEHQALLAHWPRREEP